MRAVPRRRHGGLRSRIAVLLVLVLLGMALSFYGTLVTLTRQWLRDGLLGRARTLSTELASRLAVPIVVADREALGRELSSEELEGDVVLIEVYTPEGRMLGSRGARGAFPNWQRPRPGEGAGAPEVRVLEDRNRIEVTTPILRRLSPGAGPVSEANEVLGLPLPAALASAPVGWVRLVVSTARVEASLAFAMRIGLLVVLCVLGLSVVPIILVVRATLRPLREASQLAREIAAGQLERRLPVETRDELGGLAESLNTMAAALHTSREEARAEANALRVTWEAVSAIARGARQVHDAAAMFGVIVTELRRVTACDGVALATGSEADPALRLHDFDPPLPWGDLREAQALDTALARRLARAGDSPVRIDVDHASGPVARGLARHGLRAMLVVPLALDGSPRAALLLVSRRPGAFPAAEVEVVAGLATHLSSALEATALRARLERAFEELQTARTHLLRSERLRMAGEMASGVAHEFNNVLGAILGRAQLLQRHAQRGELAPDDLLRSLRVIERAAQDGGDTVRRLRQFGRGDARTLETVDLHEVLVEASEITRTRWENEAQAAGHDIRLEWEVERGAWVTGSSSELREVFVNLILNSVDAMPQGGVLRLRCERGPERVRAWVEDDGTGMADDVRRRVFDPFFTTKGERGTGLGLSVVYGIVQRHQGEIAVYSELGYGTRMEITLPAAAAPVTAGIELVRPVPAGLALRVLVVDDEPAVRQLLHDIVEALGHASLACESAAAALAAFRPHAFDLVLTDIGMPDVTGWDLARQLRSLDPDVTIAFVTGWGQEIEQAMVAESGADAVIPKPFTIEQIEEIARTAIERRAGRDLAA